MTFTPAFYEQARRKKKEEAANAKILEAEKRNKVSKMTFKKKTEVFFFWCQIPWSVPVEFFYLPPSPLFALFCMSW